MISDEFEYYFEWEELEAFGYAGAKDATHERPSPADNARPLSSTPDEVETFSHQETSTPVPPRRSDAQQADESIADNPTDSFPADSSSTYVSSPHPHPPTRLRLRLRIRCDKSPMPTTAIPACGGY